MKTAIIILAALALNADGCGQTTNSNNILTNNKTMEQNKTETYNPFKDFEPAKQFNIEEFYLNQAKYKSAAFILNDTTKIQQIETKEYFVEYIMPNGYLFKEYNTYYKSSGSLCETGLVYKDGFIKGVLKTYNESGELIKEEDYDAPFTYTFEDVLEYIEDNKIDIHSDRVTVDRYIDENKNPIWTIKCRITDYFIRKTLDGRTGELLSTRKIQIEK